MGDNKDNGPLNGWKPEEVLKEVQQSERFRQMDETMVGEDAKSEVVSLREISQVTSFDQLMKLIGNANYLQLGKGAENTTMSESCANVKRVLQHMDEEVKALVKTARVEEQLNKFWTYVENYQPSTGADFLHGRVIVVGEDGNNESMRLDKFVL